MSLKQPIPKLTERERLILRAVVQHFILTANPVGSRHVAKRFGMNLSPATIRNVMADLEEMGLLSHPHTSAGRMPSDHRNAGAVNCFEDKYFGVHVATTR